MWGRRKTSPSARPQPLSPRGAGPRGVVSLRPGGWLGLVFGVPALELEVGLSALSLGLPSSVSEHHSRSETFCPIIKVLSKRCVPALCWGRRASGRRSLSRCPAGQALPVCLPQLLLPSDKQTETQRSPHLYANRRGCVSYADELGEVNSVGSQRASKALPSSLGIISRAAGSRRWNVNEGVTKQIRCEK